MLAAILCVLGLVGLGGAELLPDTELVTNCFNFPQDSFDTSNSVKATYGSSPHLVRDTGDSAVDFTLHDIGGIAWNLGDSLKGGKPVALIWGMSTCPAYQGLDSEGSSYRWTYWDEYALVESHRNRATFVHMYGPEPHPASPDRNFDSGKLLANYWSVSHQHLTHEERLLAAKGIRDVTHPSQVILADYLPGNPYSSLVQPVWCSYALGARAAVLIGVDGTIVYQQGWLNTDDLGEAIDGYLQEVAGGSWDKTKLESGSAASPRNSGTRKGKTAQGKIRAEKQQKELDALSP